MRHHCLSLLACEMFLISSALCQSPSVLREEISGGHIERILEVRSDNFQMKHLIELGTSFKADVMGRYKTGTLWIITSPDDLYAIQGPLATDHLFFQWRRAWLDSSKKLFAVARVIVIGEAATLQLRTKSGKYSKALLSKDDPLLIRSNGLLYEIAYLFASLRSEPSSPEEVATEYSLMLIQRGGQPTPIEAGMAANISMLLDCKKLWVESRSNIWFRGPQIPIVYPFEHAIAPPLTLAKANNQLSWCRLLGNQIKCESSGY